MQSSVYVINLERRVDRWKQISEHLKTELIRINAIDGLKIELGPENLAGNSATACWLSHQLSWKTLLERGDDYALVLEDDARLISPIQVNEILNASALFMNTNRIDLLQVGFFQELGRKRNLLKRLGLYRVRKPRNFLDAAIPNRHGIGTHAYVISRSGAAKLSKINNPTFLAADATLMYLAASQSKISRINIWQLQYSIFSQREVSRSNPSDIQ